MYKEYQKLFYSIYFFSMFFFFRLSKFAQKRQSEKKTFFMESRIFRFFGVIDINFFHVVEDTPQVFEPQAPVIVALTP